MKKLIFSVLLLLLAFCCKSQGLLSPDELALVNKSANVDVINQKLNPLGYKKSHSWLIEHVEQVDNWVFQTTTGEESDFVIRKRTTPDGKTQLYYWIANPYYFKQFVDQLTKAKYNFSGIKIIDNTSYSSFVKGPVSFLAFQQMDPSTKKTIYQILIE